jgi:hypothetical protein
MVMEAVMILKNSEPTWAEAKRQLSDVNFLTSVSGNVVASKACKSILLVPYELTRFDLISSSETSTKITYRIEFCEQ